MTSTLGGGGFPFMLKGAFPLSPRKPSATRLSSSLIHIPTTVASGFVDPSAPIQGGVIGISDASAVTQGGSHFTEVVSVGA